MNASAPSLLSVEDLQVTLPTRAGAHRVLLGVDLTLQPRETLCLVGESGSGKSMVAYALMGLLPEGARLSSRRLQFDGRDMLDAAGRRMAPRGAGMAMIFQEPMTALNPLLTIGLQITESLRQHRIVPRARERARAIELLDAVGIAEAARRVDAYPHELSGGMRQRAMIAVALAAEPRLLIADEPTTALDVTVQAQVLELLRDVQRRFGTALMLITHDMGVVADMADRVQVMYAGRAVECGTRDVVVGAVGHPYTTALRACSPRGHRRMPGGAWVPLPEIPGVVPSTMALPPGCAFAPRCARALDSCSRGVPPLAPVADGRLSACWREIEELLA